MISDRCLSIHNGKAVPISRMPCFPFEEFRRILIESVDQGARVCSLFCHETRNQSGRHASFRLVAVLADDIVKSLAVMSTEVDRKYPSLTPSCPQVHLFEREIAEQWGVVPEGHPWLKPVRFHPPLRGETRAGKPSSELAHLPGVTEFFRLEGEEVHEVAVGPVHAGVIEPGHFRFQCYGEKVYHLEISLGYQHRGLERALFGGPHKSTLCQIETAAGDTTVGHTVAYCQAIEALCGLEVPERAQAIRSIGLELERLANHTGDLGALSGDVGFLPTAAYCGRIRGDFLNMTALLCGSRLGRGLVRVGGVGYDFDTRERLENLVSSLAKAEEDARVAIELLWDTPTVMSRFEITGTVSHKDCQTLGLVGPAARACGFRADVRLDFPTGHYKVVKVSPVPDPEKRTGDVEARAVVRWEEILNSLLFLRQVLPKLPSGAVTSQAPGKGVKVVQESKTQQSQAGGKFRLAPDSLVVSLIEGWRGEICHTAMTDSQGNFFRYKIVDPSFHNWMGLAVALRNQEISDFPLCNKSFNLSYCGFDL